MTTNKYFVILSFRKNDKRFICSHKAILSHIHLENGNSFLKAKYPSKHFTIFLYKYSIMCINIYDILQL